MTLLQIVTEFHKKYIGKQVEYHSYDPRAIYQCVDLVNQFIKEIGLTPVIGTNAKDFPSKIKTTEFEVLKNTIAFIPRAGDIPIWNDNVGGGAGHIAIVRDNRATQQKFYSLDQNWSKPYFVTTEVHSYTNVTHFLRPKRFITTEPVKETMPDNRSPHDAKWVEEQLMHLDNEREKVRLRDIQISELKTEITQLNEEINKLAKTPVATISKQVEVAGFMWQINGIQVDSTGKVTANYSKN